MSKNIAIVGLAVLTLLFAVLYFTRPPSFGANATGPAHYQMENFLQGLQAGTGNQFSLSNTGAVTLGSAATFSSTGNAVTRINFGTCAILAYATTIAASTTATVDCSTTGLVGGTLTGIKSGDNVMAMATTSISSTYLGVQILSAAASTTPGYLTLQLINETGTTFTWTATASSTIAYRVFK